MNNHIPHALNYDFENSSDILEGSNALEAIWELFRSLKRPVAIVGFCWRLSHLRHHDKAHVKRNSGRFTNNIAFLIRYFCYINLYINLLLFRHVSPYFGPAGWPSSSAEIEAPPRTYGPWPGGL